MPVWLAFRSREPVYEGKTLSTWLAQCSLEAGQTQTAADLNPGSRSEAAIAISQMGTNCIPFLLKLMSAQESPPKLVKAVFRPVPRPILDFLGIQKAMERWGLESMMKPHLAWIGFKVLGAEGNSAVSDLIGLMRHSASVNTRRCAAYSLGAMRNICSARFGRFNGHLQRS